MPLAARLLLGVAWVLGTLAVAVAAGLNADPRDTAAAGLAVQRSEVDVVFPAYRAMPQASERHQLTVPLAASVLHEQESQLASDSLALIADEPGDDAEETPTPAPPARFILPLAEWSYVTDRFGAYRGAGIVHEGIDLAVNGRLSHSPIYASCGGTVSIAEYSRIYGYYVVVDCGEGWATLYAHMSQMLVTAGQPVEQSAVLGRTGITGLTTGEHLHFEIWHRGTPVNPEHHLDFRIPPGTPISTGPLRTSGRDSGTARAAADAPRPSPTPVPTPTPVESLPSPTPTPMPSPSATSTPTPSPSPSATPTPIPSPSPSTTPTPIPSPTVSSSPTPTAQTTPEVTETATPTAAPASPTATPGDAADEEHNSDPGDS